MLRELRPIAKDRRRVPIPEDLREIMREVHQVISDADLDEDIGYGDAIQVRNLYGGKIGTARRPFVFTYFPADAPEGCRWSLTLHETEVEDIADGVLTSLMLSCCVSPTCHCKFLETDEHCLHCDYVENPKRGTIPIADAIPLLDELGMTGVSETSTLADVKVLLGEPFQTGGGTNFGNLTIHPWAKFRAGDREVHFEFWTNGGRVKSVTL